MICQGFFGKSDWEEFYPHPKSMCRPSPALSALRLGRGIRYNYLGAEFVNMYKKDDWTPLRSEFEPFTFNDYGSKVPLAIHEVGLPGPSNFGHHLAHTWLIGE